MNEEIKIIIYTRPDFIPDEIGYAFWEIPTFVGNNPSEVVEIVETNGKYVFPCDVKVCGLEGQPLSVKGIFDTGATKTCITPKLIKELQLKQNGTYNYTTMGGKRASPRYPLMLSIDGITGNFKLNVGDVGYDIDGIDVLIGLDVICHGELHIKRQEDGRYSLRFDVPLLPITLNIPR